MTDEQFREMVAKEVRPIRHASGIPDEQVIVMLRQVRDQVTAELMPPHVANVDVSHHAMNCPANIPMHEEDCTCGLKWRRHLQTEQTLHAAWRKRAEEAEKRQADLSVQLGATMIRERKLLDCFDALGYAGDLDRQAVGAWKAETEQRVRRETLEWAINQCATGFSCSCRRKIEEELRRAAEAQPSNR